MASWRTSYAVPRIPSRHVPEDREGILGPAIQRCPAMSSDGFSIQRCSTIPRISRFRFTPLLQVSERCFYWVSACELVNALYKIRRSPTASYGPACSSTPPGQTCGYRSRRIAGEIFYCQSSPNRLYEAVVQPSVGSGCSTILTSGWTR